MNAIINETNRTIQFNDANLQEDWHEDYGGTWKDVFCYSVYRSVNGIPFSEELAGPNGMSYILFAFKGIHSQEDINKAKRKIRQDQDVVHMFVRTYTLIGPAPNLMY